jgi:arylsulfatase A-like enzyme/Tfp pilus assembly protein PilF
LLVIVLGVLAALGGAWLVWWTLAVPVQHPPIAAGAFRGHNLLLITIDTLRADHLGCYGGDSGLTPNLDGLAAEGIRFAEVLAHVPLTLPAHTSLFTSKYPTGHGVHDNGTFRVDSSLPTLAFILKEGGYQTGAFVGAFVLDARFGLTRGFDVYDDYYGEQRAFVDFGELERRAEAVVEPAESWIGGQAREPWFAWVHLFDPHTPYDAPEAHRRAHPDDPYGAEVAYVDDVVGTFLERLKRKNGLRRTLVALVGDHGESLGDHGEETHGTFAYNATLWVPWILWAEEGISPRVFEGTVRHVDFMPTVLDLLGITRFEDLDGQSLRPYLSGDERYEPPLTYFEALNVHLTRDWAPLRGVVDEGHKLIRLPIPELYDLERDPGETVNLYEREGELARKLEERLSHIVGGSETIEADLPDLETVEKLQALGYVTAPVTERKAEYTEDDDPKRLIDVSNAYDEATDLFARGQRAEAVAILEDLVRKQPHSSQAYQKLAYAYHQMGRLGHAVGVLENAVENGVQEMSLLALLGAYLLEVDRVPEAKSLLEDMVRGHPDYAEGHNYLGIAYGRLGMPNEARVEFEKVLELDPSSARTYNNLGSLALARGDFREAERLLTEALRYDPDLASAHNGLGVVYARTGDLVRSVESWRRAVELNPGLFDALYNLAIALADSSPREAVPYLERFIREAPTERYRADIDRVRDMLRRIESGSL